MSWYSLSNQLKLEFTYDGHAGTALTIPTKVVELKTHTKGVRLYSKKGYFSSGYSDSKDYGFVAHTKIVSWNSTGGEVTLEGGLLSAMMDDLRLDATIPSVKLNGPAAKWRVISGLQKAIRRGMAETAVKCALAMESHDSKYLWRRLMVIALEDLGIPGIEIAALIGYLAGKEVFRRGLDGHEGKLVLAYIVEEMAKLPKDRAFCELANAAHFHRTDELRDLCFDKSVDRELLLEKHIAHGTELTLATRFTYGLAVAGGLKRTIKGKHGQDVPEYCPNERALYMKWVYSEEADLPAALRYAVRRGMGLGAEGLYISAPLVWPFFKKEKEYASIVDLGALPSSELIRKLPAAAYDHHTTEGKKCIAYFMKSCKPVHDFLETFDHPNKLRLIGSALFCREGGLVVDRRFDYPAAIGIVSHAYGGEWKNHRFSSKDHMYAFYDLVAAHLPELNAVRRKLLDAE